MALQYGLLKLFGALVFWGFAWAVGMANASECIDNHWQPTFVHDNDCPDGPYFVLPGGGFIKLLGNTEGEWIPQACQLIQQYGLRDRSGFTNCRAYTRVQCGCRRGMSEGNVVCASFLGGRPIGSIPQCADRRPMACQPLRSMNQQESRDAYGRILVEASTIHVMSCGGVEVFIYEYMNRHGYRVIRPPDWGHAIGGRDFATFDEAQAVASGSYAPSGIASPQPPRPQPPQPGNCPPGSIELLGVCSQGGVGR
jgi:hypothetical protein